MTSFQVFAKVSVLQRGNAVIHLDKDLADLIGLRDGDFVLPQHVTDDEGEKIICLILKKKESDFPPEYKSISIKRKNKR
jgi:hypothetical protein